MQELEKILEEIDQEKKNAALSIRHTTGYKAGQIRMAERIEEIIRKHINDGWIPVEVKPTEDGFYVTTMSGALVDQEEPFVGLAEFEDGEWVDGDDVIIAWRHLPEPYRPERSDNNDGE